MTPLCQKMINDMKLRRFAPKTQQAYVSAVSGVAKYFGRSPDMLSENDVQHYLLYLMDDRKLSWSTCNIVISGLKFLYDVTLGNPSMTLSIPPRRKEKHCAIAPILSEAN